MAFGDLYRLGLVTLDSGDRTHVIGSGTAWSFAVRPGDSFELGGYKVTIIEVTDDENLVLAYAWPGTDFTAVAYVIVQDSRQRVEAFALAGSVSDLVQKLTIFNHARPLFSIKQFGIATIPGGSVAGDAFVVGAGAGDLLGHDNDVVEVTTNGLLFSTPEHGWHIDSETDGSGTNVVRHWTGTAWETTGALAAAPKYEGAWDSATAYVAGNVVSYLNTLYIASQAGTNKTPSSEPSYWDTLSRVGEPGGAFTVQYTFKTATAEATAETSGQVCADAALGSAPTKLYVNVNDVFGTDWGAFLASIADMSDSVIKAGVRMVKVGNPAKQFVASVTSVAITSVHYVLSLAATPTAPYAIGTSLADNDPVLLAFTPKGDVGDTGATGATGTVGPIGGPIAIPLTFKDVQADADPGDGNARLNQATQGDSTVLRIDTKNNLGGDIAGLLDAIDQGQTGDLAIGSLRHKDTPDTKWITFRITALAVPSGYRNLSIVKTAQSGVNPFAADDPLVFSYVTVEQGAQGDQGIQGDQGDSFTPQYVVALIADRATYDFNAPVTSGVRLSVLVERDSTNNNKATLYFLQTAAVVSPPSDAVWSVGVDFAPGAAASAISYDNIGSGLSATDAQAAIDEVLTRGTVLEAAAIDINSDAICDIGALASVRARMLGTTNITSFGTQPNKVRIVRYTDSLIVFNDPTNLHLLINRDRYVNADDVGIYTSDSLGRWREAVWAPGSSSYYALSDAPATLPTYVKVAALGEALTAPRIVTLPPAASTDEVIICDAVGGVSATNPLNIVASDPDKINGGTYTVTLSTPYGRIVFTSDGTNWTYNIDLTQALATIASAATTEIGAVSAQCIDLTGSATINSFGSAFSTSTVAAPIGAVKYVKFAAGIVLTYNATSMILIGGKDITMDAGDFAIMQHYSQGHWRMATFSRADGSRTGVTDGSDAASGRIGQIIQCASQNTTAVVTISNASPGIISRTAHGLKAGAVINFTTTGALPTGLSVGVNYYVAAGSTLLPNSFAVCADAANALAGTSLIATTSAGSGTHTCNDNAILGSASATVVAAIVLLAGDWELHGIGTFNPATSTSITALNGAVNSSAALASANNDIANPSFNNKYAAIVPGTGAQSFSVPSGRVSLAAPANYYLVVRSTFTVSTMTGCGLIWARRVR